MVRSLQKVQKHISRKKGAVEALHENSRDASRLRRAAIRDDRVARVKSAMSRARDQYVQRVSFFKENVTTGSGALSDDGLMDLALRYINRDVPEIEQLQSERRKGRPPSRREEALTQRTNAEKKELQIGFWMPDLTESEVLKTLEKWKGDWAGLGPMKFIRLTRDGKKQPSSFPPNALS